MATIFIIAIRQGLAVFQKTATRTTVGTNREYRLWPEVISEIDLRDRLQENLPQTAEVHIAETDHIESASMTGSQVDPSPHREDRPLGLLRRSPKLKFNSGAVAQ
jgi:hypothetical protein